MAYQAAASIYKKNQVQTSSPKQLIVLLYEGAIKNIRLAELATEQENHEKRSKYLVKAQDIVTELNVSLNHEEGKEIAEQLSGLYDYILNELVQANLEKDISKMQHAREMLSDLLEAWNKI
jgi:flagellar protein FliS